MLSWGRLIDWWRSGRVVTLEVRDKQGTLWLWADLLPPSVSPADWG